MSLDPSPHVLHDDSPAEMTARYQNKGSSPTGVDPDMLRWRAEVLLDEMMLGGVDLAAGEPGSHTAWPTTATPSPTTRVYENGSEVSPAARTYPPAGPSYENGHNGNYKPGDTAVTTATSAIDHACVSPTHAREPIDYFSLEWTERSEQSTRPPPEESAPAAPVVSPPQTEGQAWVFSAEERYRKLALQQESPQPDLPVEPPVNGAGEVVWPEAAPPTVERASPVAPPTVRRVANQFAGSVAAPGGAKRSNLLPRTSAADAEAVQREIFTLQNEIDLKLPVGHDSNTRAHHLLEKALAILQADPTRSAEVEYYLQQVRTIFQRVQQTIDWSSVYRNRLLVYVTAWSLLALIVLTAHLLYQEGISQFWSLYGGLAPESFAAKSIVVMSSAFFAGALGGALSVLISLQRQSRLPHGFIDRKFGLRGLILPVIGAIVGSLIALIFATVYSALGLDPAQQLWMSLLPTLCALLFGLGQESLYGTRE
jgi:hypothetical protein